MESKLAMLRLMRVRLALLIEPVWNRKHALQALPGANAAPFNRTSMESKHLLTRYVLHQQHYFLIEPVWNRNTVSYATN